MATLYKCTRCGGSGNVGYGPHGGVCYKCNGAGTQARKPAAPRAPAPAKVTPWTGVFDALVARYGKPDCSIDCAAGVLMRTFEAEAGFMPRHDAAAWTAALATLPPKG